MFQFDIYFSIVLFSLVYGQSPNIYFILYVDDMLMIVFLFTERIMIDVIIISWLKLYVY